MERILIIDDDKNALDILSEIIMTEGYEVITADDGIKALKEIKKHSPDLVLLDIKLPGINGMEVLREIKKLDSGIVVIMLTAYGEIKESVHAMKMGAFNYLTKPFSCKEIVVNIKKALQTRHLGSNPRILPLEGGGEKVPGHTEFVGESPLIMQALSKVEIVAPTNMTVIIQGESGTGKEMIARMIHQKSLRHSKPFIVVDCGIIPENLVESELFGYEKGAFTGADAKKEGKFESANNGTLFLDEITNLTQTLQAKLLRVIQERKIQHLGGAREITIDVRIITATNTTLSDEVKNGRFREDLYHRFNEFAINLPSLRERKEDLPILVEYFLKEANLEFNKKIEGISSETMKSLLVYRWPGNVRELRNEVRRAALLTDSTYISKIDFPADVSPSNPGKIETIKDLDKCISLREIVNKNTEAIEKEIIKNALVQAKNNKTKAAKILKIDRMTLYSKIKSFGL